MNKPDFKYKKPETNTSELRTPVEFYNSKVLDGLDGRDVNFEKVFYTFAKIYSPSLKDLEISTGKSMTAKMTLKIRDPLTSYQPDTKDFVQVNDHRVENKKWQIIDVRPDYDNRDYLIVIIGGPND